MKPERKKGGDGLDCLTSEEYDSILRFNYFINKDYSNFIQNVLFATAEICQWPLSVYTVFDRDPVLKEAIVDSIYSNSIYMYGLEEYRSSKYKTDLFFLRGGEHEQQGKTQTNVLTIQDVATYEEFYETEYGKYLLNINTPYQVVLRHRQAEAPAHILNVFKTGEQGDFTSHELLYLQHMGQVFSKSVGQYKRYLSNTIYKKFLDVETEEWQQGIAIIDGRNNVAYQNERFLSTISALLGTRGVFAAVKALYSAFKAQTGLEAEEMMQPAFMELHGYKVRISPHFISNGEAVQKYLFITVERLNEPAATTVVPKVESKRDISLDYGLTPREMEVAGLLAEGLDNGQIADKLCVNITTVKYHVKNIYQKVGLNRRAAVISKLLQ